MTCDQEVSFPTAYHPLQSIAALPSLSLKSAQMLSLQASEKLPDVDCSALHSAVEPTE